MPGGSTRSGDPTDTGTTFEATVSPEDDTLRVALELAEQRAWYEQLSYGLRALGHTPPHPAVTQKRTTTRRGTITPPAPRTHPCEPATTPSTPNARPTVTRVRRVASHVLVGPEVWTGAGGGGQTWERHP